MNVGPDAARLDRNRHLLRARDTMDRDYASDLDIPCLARIALVSETHFIRTFRDTKGHLGVSFVRRRRLITSRSTPGPADP